MASPNAGWPPFPFQPEGPPFPFQPEVWAALQAGESGLLHATTGAGKTCAVWLGALERFAGVAPRSVGLAPLTVLWITPMRALASDTARPGHHAGKPDPAAEPRRRPGGLRRGAPGWWWMPLLAETHRSREGWYLFLYPFAGRQVHLGLALGASGAGDRGGGRAADLPGGRGDDLATGPSDLSANQSSEMPVMVMPKRS